MSNLSPSIVTLSNVIYLNGPLIKWNSIVETSFQNYPENISLYKNLRNETVKILTIIQSEYLTNPNTYTTVLPVSFESKVKFMMSIMKVSIIHKNIQ
jgi:hypothetical protein